MIDLHRRTRPARAGFTLIELLIALVVGLVVIAASANFAASTLRSSRGSTLRDGLNRDARYVGMAITRDMADAGIAFESAPFMGPVAMRNDTLVILSVPYRGNREAEVYAMTPPASPVDPLPAGGTCGATCIAVVDPGLGPFELAPGDLALLRVQTERRLIVITSVCSGCPPGAREITFSTADSLFTFPAGLTGGLRLRRTGVSVQKVNVAGWYRDAIDSTLRRVSGFTAGGQLKQVIAARGIDYFNTRLLFTNGTEHPRADGFDADTLNDHTKIVSIIARARLRTLQRDRSVNGGVPLVRDYEWRVSPRNLIFERNRER